MRRLVLVFMACASNAPPPAVVAPTPVAVMPSEPMGIPAGYIDARPVEVAQLGERGALLLLDETTNLIVPIFIGGTEAASIDLRMRGDAAPRPLTHDLLDALVKKLGGTIVKVQIDALRDGIFIGSVFVRANGRVFKVDARPSDAIALAIGNRVKIYVAKAVVEEAGIPRDELMRQLAPSGTGPIT